MRMTRPVRRVGSPERACRCASIPIPILMHRAVSFCLTLAALVASCVPRAGRGTPAEGPARAMAAPDPSVEPTTVANDLSSAAAEADARSPPSSDPSCPDSMLLVEGDYCTQVRQECIRWEDPPTSRLARCAVFAPSQCVGRRVHRRFCVDRDEYSERGQSLPAGDVSWTKAREICTNHDKRLCLESEWEFACEGEGMLPYPTGYDRDATACNYDKGNLVDPATGRLRDQRQPSGQLDRCVSPFGVRNMSGNIDEWVWRDRTGGEWRSALKGGWWMAARDRCRPATTSHNESYHELQTGLRCCADAR
jgi:sulfatase modifying factor 1